MGFGTVEAAFDMIEVFWSEKDDPYLAARVDTQFLGFLEYRYVPGAAGFANRLGGFDELVHRTNRIGVVVIIGWLNLVKPCKLVTFGCN